MSRERPLPTGIAAAMLALLSAINLASPLLRVGSLPALAVYVSAAMGAAGLAAAAGLWNLRRWAMVLTCVVSVLSMLASAPGLAFAPTPGILASAIAGTAGYALVLILALLPASRRAYAPRLAATRDPQAPQA